MHDLSSPNFELFDSRPPAGDAYTTRPDVEFSFGGSYYLDSDITSSAAGEAPNPALSNLGDLEPNPMISGEPGTEGDGSEVEIQTITDWEAGLRQQLTERGVPFESDKETAPADHEITAPGKNEPEPPLVEITSDKPIRFGAPGTFHTLPSEAAVRAFRTGPVYPGATTITDIAMAKFGQTGTDKNILLTEIDGKPTAVRLTVPGDGELALSGLTDGLRPEHLPDDPMDRNAVLLATAQDAARHYDLLAQAVRQVNDHMPPEVSEKLEIYLPPADTYGVNGSEGGILPPGVSGLMTVTPMFEGATPLDINDEVIPGYVVRTLATYCGLVRSSGLGRVLADDIGENQWNLLSGQNAARFKGIENYPDDKTLVVMDDLDLTLIHRLSQDPKDRYSLAGVTRRAKWVMERAIRAKRNSDQQR